MKRKEIILQLLDIQLSVRDSLRIVSIDELETQLSSLINIEGQKLFIAGEQEKGVLSASLYGIDVVNLKFKPLRVMRHSDIIIPNLERGMEKLGWSQIFNSN
jgi:hypothetical protein